MKFPTSYVSFAIAVLILSLLTACGAGQAAPQPVDEVVEAESQPLDEPVVEDTEEPTPEPTPEPTEVPVIEPEIIEINEKVRLLTRGLPDDITLDYAIDLELIDAIPDSTLFDYVHSEIAVIDITNNGAAATLDMGIVEICFTTVQPPGTSEAPIAFYWDTSRDPLPVGRQLRVTNVEKEPELVVCTTVQNSGAYALASH